MDSRKCPTCGSENVPKLVADETCHEYGGPTLWDKCKDAFHDGRRYDVELENIVRRLAQSVIDASDEEIEEDARQAGVNLSTDATRLEVEYWKSRAKTAELKVLTFYEEIKNLGGSNG